MSGVKFRINQTRREKSIVVAEICINGKRTKRTTGVSVEVAKWDSRRGRCKERAGEPLTVGINKRLNHYALTAESVISDLIASGRPYTGAQVFDGVERILSGGRAAKTVYLPEYIRNYIPRARIGINTAKAYVTTAGIIERFERAKKKRITFAEVDVKMYNALYAYMHTNGYSDNYFGAVIKHIKHIYRYAREVDELHDLHATENAAFVTIKKHHRNIYLTAEELQKIYDLQITPEVVSEMLTEEAKKSRKKPLLNPANILRRQKGMQDAKNKFLVGAYTALRVSDYKHLTNESIDGNFIKLKTQKTGAFVVVPLHRNLRQMIADGIDICQPLSEQKINEHIKQVCRMAGITQPTEGTKKEGNRVRYGVFPKCDMVTTHTARRSAATNMYLAGIPSIAIMRLTGHTTERVFLNYICVSEEENALLLAGHEYFK